MRIASDVTQERHVAATAAGLGDRMVTRSSATNTDILAGSVLTFLPCQPSSAPRNMLNILIILMVLFRVR